MRKNTKGVSAVIATILMLMITIALAGLAYMFISGTFTQRTGVIIELDETATICLGTTIHVYVRNTGTIATDASKVSLSGINSQGTTITGGVCGLATTAINAGGGSKLCATTLTGTQGSNTVIASGPANTAKGPVYCQG